MKLRITEKTIRTATIVATIYLLLFGVAMAIFPIRPFWNDEWRLLYNIKFKTVPQLWGRLDLLQECPRVYLTLLKKITSAFDYNYISIRMPALVISCCSILLLYHLKKRIYPTGGIYSYLFILILLSSQTFTDYIVQVKQYEMDIFLCLLILWQLLTLTDITEKGITSRAAYILLCFSFLVAPFWAYIYPIAFAPVPVVIVFMLFTSANAKRLWHNVVAVIAPMVLAVIGIVILYLIDIRQVIADEAMYASYKQMLGYKAGETHYLLHTWNLFSLVGSGDLFEVIFGIVGLSAFCYVAYRILSTRKGGFTQISYIYLYCLGLLVVTLALLLSGRLMGGVARLVAFTVPAISILIIALLTDVNQRFHHKKVANTVAAVLFIGLFGNIASTCINRFAYPEYANRIRTYWHTSRALQLARQGKEPILITKGLLGDPIKDSAIVPGKIVHYSIDSEQIAGPEFVCPEVVLKVNPEYKVWDSVQVYTMPDARFEREYFYQLPAGTMAAIACDGINITRFVR